METKGVRGYVNDSSLSTPKSTIKIVSSKGGLIVKKLPTTNSATSATLKYNMIVEDFGSVGGGWSFVQYGNVTGYVNSKFINVAKTTTLYAGLDLAVRNIASPGGAQVATIEKGTQVIVHSTLVGWSYVTTGNTKGYVVAAQLTNKKPKITATGFGFQQGLLPLGLKSNTKFFYNSALSFGLDNMMYNKVTYSGSKSKGSMQITIGYEDSDVPRYDSSLEKYAEDTKGFSYNGYASRQATIKVDYPVKVGNTKTYSDKYTDYVFDDKKGDYVLVSATRTIKTTVKAVNSTYTIPNIPSRFAGEKFTQAIAVETVDSTGDKGIYVFQVNKGIVFGFITSKDEAYDDEEIHVLTYLNSENTLQFYKNAKYAFSD